MARIRNKVDLDKDNIPKDVVNKEAYLEACELQEHELLLPENRIRQTSDPELVVNLAAGTYILRNKIAHLPQKEQTVLLKAHTEIKRILGKINAIKYKAYGYAPHKKLGEGEVMPKLYDQYKPEVMDLLPRFHKAPEIQDIMQKRHGVMLRGEWIHAVLMTNMDAINEKQEEYKRQYGDVRLAHKRSRIDEMMYLYLHRKNIYQKSLNRDDYKLLLQTLNQIKSEVEGDIVINGHIEHDMELSINRQLNYSEIQANKVILFAIIAKLAAKRGTNPLFYLSKLENSMYAAYTGVRGGSISNDTPIWPSQITFGLDTVIDKAIENDGKDAIVMNTIPIEVQTSENKDLKNALLERIKAKQNTVGASLKENLSITDIGGIV